MYSSSSVTGPSEGRSSTCSYGLILLGLTYVALSATLHFVYPDDCSGEECQSEGVDNSYLAIASSYFVAAVCFLHALHLRCFRRSTRRSGVVSQVFLAGAFGLMGFRAHFFPNSGQTDNKGMMEFWIVGAIANFFLALSAVAQTKFAVDATARLPQNKLPLCALFFMHFWAATIILITIVNIVGSIWCSISPSLQTDGLVDNFQDNLYWNERHVCLQLVGLSENLIWFPYALLWVPVGLLLRAAARQRPALVLGLSNTRAALGAIGFQWTTGSMYLVAASFASWIRHEMDLTGDNDETFLELWKRFYGVEVFHFGILMSSYCAHNLTWTLTVPSFSRLSSNISIISNNTRPKVVPPPVAGSNNSKRVRFSEEASATEIDLEADLADTVPPSVSPEKEPIGTDATPSVEEIEMTIGDTDDSKCDGTSMADTPENSTAASGEKKAWTRMFSRRKQ